MTSPYYQPYQQYQQPTDYPKNENNQFQQFGNFQQNPQQQQQQQQTVPSHESYQATLPPSVTPGWNDPPSILPNGSTPNRLANLRRRPIDPSITGNSPQGYSGNPNGQNPYASYATKQQPGVGYQQGAQQYPVNNVSGQQTQQQYGAYSQNYSNQAGNM